MNAKRRKALNDISKKIDELKSELEDLREEEEEYMENMPENLWGSERYENSQECIDEMAEAEDSLEMFTSLIESIVDR